ncbi:MAG: alpha/beta hydrolase [Cyclobacteriaceae bacterium]
MKHLKEITLTLAILAFCFTYSQAQSASGKLLESLSMESKILKKAVNYCIYLPPGYDISQRSYPIVYLLHGYTDNETGWVQFGEAHIAAEQAIVSREIPPMIIVMPDAGVTWYINDHQGNVRYEDMFFQEFIPFIESQYRVRAKKEFRGIAGLSMGGYGSLIYALKHPDLFAASAPLSAAIYTEEEVVNHEQERWERIESVMYGAGITGQDRITDHWKANNPLHIAQNSDIEKLKTVRYYFDCGDDDFLYKGNAAAHVLFRDLEIPHEFRVRDGAHNWIYWRTGIVDALKFIGESFHR